MNSYKLAASIITIIMVSALYSFLVADTVNTSAKTEIKKIKVGDVELAYQIRGEGKPLLMINGYKCTISTWDPELLSLLEKNYQLILFDNRGVGLSTDTPENHTTMAQMADDATGLITALGFDKANVLGWSMGARIAQQAVIRHPEVIEKLILCAANPGGTHQVATSEEAKKKLNNPNLTKEESVGLFFPPTPEGQKAAIDYLTRLEKAVKAKEIPNDFDVPPETIKRQDLARAGTWDTSNDNFNALASIKIPVLITDGKEDIIDLPGNVNVIGQQIPFSWIAYFDGGHAYLFQYQKRFSDLVKAFLE